MEHICYLLYLLINDYLIFVLLPKGVFLSITWECDPQSPLWQWVSVLLPNSYKLRPTSILLAWDQNSHKWNIVRFKIVITMNIIFFLWFLMHEFVGVVVMNGHCVIVIRWNWVNWLGVLYPQIVFSDARHTKQIEYYQIHEKRTDFSFTNFKNMSLSYNTILVIKKFYLQTEENRIIIQIKCLQFIWN